MRETHTHAHLFLCQLAALFVRKIFSRIMACVLDNKAGLVVAKSQQAIFEIKYQCVWVPLKRAVKFRNERVFKDR